MKPENILYHVTQACKPDDLVETTRGQVTYRQWCEEEVARIRNKSGWPVQVYTNPNTGEISVVHLKISKRA
jgi:hypothetical protein